MEAIQTMVYRVMATLQTLRDEESGQGLVEYALIIAGVSIALIGALAALAGPAGIEGVFTEIEAAL